MDYLTSLLNIILNDPQYFQWAIYLIAGLTGVTLAIAISLLVSGAYSPLKSRLEVIKHEGSTTHHHQQQEVLSTLEHGLDQAAKKPLFKFSNETTRKLMIHAGFHSENALALFNGIRLMALLVAGLASFFAFRLLPDLSNLVTLYLFALFFGLAFMLPTMVLRYFANSRMKMLRLGFPDALDLLVVCCEAGLGLLAAIQRVAKELAISHEDLASELDLVCSKVRAGLTVKVALDEFISRTGLEDIKGLNSAISQSIRLGTGIAQTLRVFSDEYRDKRLQAAEEQAAKLAVKMIFPMMGCIWPSFFIVAVGPAILKVMSVWDKAF
ncbi:MAG: type II secretion system F family protein [Gammaproteobacteria bacterium]|nr:type II secretion system F family protein [Gammaproteobacteria bacterium]